MIYFAIRHKPSGNFLPMFKGRAGGSWVEPTDEEPPRLFRDQSTAKGYLTVWLKGGVTVKVVSYLYEDYEPDPEWIETPQPHRKREDMEIVKMRIVEDLL